MKAHPNIATSSSAGWFRLAVIAAAMLLAGWFLYHMYAGENTKKASSTLEVTAKPAATRMISSTISALGTVYANESVDISASVTDTIKKFNVSDGQKVKRGDIIAELEHDEENTQLASARATVVEHQRELDRLKKLVVGGTIPRQQLDLRTTQLEVAKHHLKRVEAQIAHRVIKAPFDGIVGVRKLSIGALVQPGQVIATIDDISEIKLDFTVPSQYLSKLKVGQKIAARTDAIADEVFKGRVQSIDTRIDPVSRSIFVRAIIPNPDLKLKPGLLMRVDLKEAKREALMVPEESIVGRGRNHFVFVVGEDDLAQLNKVALGERIPGFVEIKSGIKESDLVVTRGVINLCDGQKVIVHKAHQE